MGDYQPRFSTDPVWFNGVKINNLDAHTTGVGVMIDGIAGWDGAFDVRDVRENRPVSDGEDVDSSFLGGRTITVYGTVYGSSWEDLQSRKRVLMTTFAPSSSEVLFKVPDPTTASPTGTYAAESMSGYERVSCKIVEPLVFGDTVDGLSQSWQVVLRASDPRIYSDTITTDDGTITYNGRATTPLKISAPLNLATSLGCYLQEVGVDTFITLDGSRLDADTLANANNRVVIDSTTQSSYVEALQMEGRASVYVTVLNTMLWGYQLTETSGTTVTNIQGDAGRNGTYVNSPTLNQTGPYGATTKSVSFDGINDHISRSFVAGMHNSVFTFETHVYNPSGVVFDLDPASGYGFKVDCTNNAVNVLFGKTALPAQNILGTRHDLGSNVWQHIVVVSTGSVVKLYVNGTLRASATYTYTVPLGSNMYIGREHGGGYYSGQVSMTYMYNRAFSDAMISDLYNSASTRTRFTAFSGRWITGVNRFPFLRNGVSEFTGHVASSSITTEYRSARL